MDEYGSGWHGALRRRHARRQAASPEEKRKTLHGWSAVRVLLTIFLVTFAAYSLVRAVSDYREAAVLRDGSELAAGRVEKTVRTKEDDYAEVRFTTRDGRTVSAKVTAWEERPSQGDRMTVCYAPRDPASYAQDARVCPDSQSAGFGAVASLVVLVLLTAVWSPPLLRRALNRRS